MPRARRTRAATGKQVETLRHEADTRTNIPTAEYQSLVREEHGVTPARGLPAAQPGPGPPARLEGQGRAGPGRPGGERAAPVHPGEGAPQGHHRRPDAAIEGEPGGGRAPDRHVRRLQRACPRAPTAPSSTSTTPTGQNRMILGDSLQVMVVPLRAGGACRARCSASTSTRPTALGFNSNFQWSTTSRDVRDGKREHITREPEQVKAYRDHLAGRHPLLLDLPSRPPHRGPRPAGRLRLHLCADRRRERSPRAGH